jgi:excisionase family DNA binding protein
MDSDFNTRRTISVDQAARVIGIGRDAAYDAVRNGDIPSIRVGRRILVPIKALDRLLDVGGAA